MRELATSSVTVTVTVRVRVRVRVRARVRARARVRVSCGQPRASEYTREHAPVPRLKLGR
jgi:hypothetical protein